jgi:hypothetical protein
MKKALEYEREVLQRRMRAGATRVPISLEADILHTEEQPRAEQEAEKALEMKVAKMLSHGLAKHRGPLATSLS